MKSKDISKESGNMEEKEWSPRKASEFIELSRITPEERKITHMKSLETATENLARIKFTCQPKARDSEHSSLDTITKTTPLKEVIYRLLMNNRKQMKLGDIVEKTLEIQKTRNLRFNTIGQDIHEVFYRIIKQDTHYGFEEVE